MYIIQGIIVFHKTTSKKQGPLLDLIIQGYLEMIRIPVYKVYCKLKNKYYLLISVQRIGLTIGPYHFGLLDK